MKRDNKSWFLEMVQLDIAEKALNCKKQINNDILWKQANNSNEDMFAGLNPSEYRIIICLACFINYPYFKFIDLKVNKLIDVEVFQLADWLGLEQKQIKNDKDKIINALLNKEIKFNIIDDQGKLIQVISNIFAAINYYEEYSLFQFEVKYEVLNALINLNKENIFFYDPQYEENA